MGRQTIQIFAVAFVSKISRLIFLISFAIISNGCFGQKNDELLNERCCLKSLVKQKINELSSVWSGKRYQDFRRAYPSIVLTPISSSPTHIIATLNDVNFLVNVNIQLGIVHSIEDGSQWADCPVVELNNEEKEKDRESILRKTAPTDD